MNKGMGILIIGGLVLWGMSREKPAPKVVTEKVIQPKAKETKQPKTEQPTLSKDTWQGLAAEDFDTMPLTTEEKSLGGVETYNPTPEPIAIGDTGFSVQGKTESGAVIVSQNDPSTYSAADWYL